MFDRRIALASAGRLAAFAALLGGATGCGNLTAGGFGEASVAMSGDAADPAPASPLQPVSQWSASAPAGTSHDEEPEGEIEAVFRLFLIPEVGIPVRLGDGDLQVRLDVGGDVEVTAVDGQLVPAARYVSLRIAFTEFEVEIDSGLIIGGIPVVGPIEVEFEDTTLVVERSVDLDVAEGGSISMIVDLNALAWLQVVDPITLAVSEAEVANLINVGIR